MAEMNEKGRQVQSDSILVPIPTTIDFSERWLVDYWAGELGVTVDRLRQAVEVVGASVQSIRTFVNGGFRIAIRDESGTVRSVMRILQMSDGFAASVPYHPAKKGFVFKMPLDYSVRRGVAKIPDDGRFAVGDVVKLSMHMTGFVQFSRGGQNPIISGWNKELEQAKGVGIRAPSAVNVTTGPLFGAIFQGMNQFTPLGNAKAEAFEQEDFWHNPDYTGPDCTNYYLQFMMLPRALLSQATLAGGQRTLTLQLPFRSEFQFPHRLRVLELPGLPCFLGAILSRVKRDSSIDSGYKLSGPGCRDANGQFWGIYAWYPRPPMLAVESLPSLDYVPPAPDTYDAVRPALEEHR